jgi:hypothetical protein
VASGAWNSAVALICTDAETSKSADALNTPRLKLPTNPIATEFMSVFTANPFVGLER